MTPCSEGLYSYTVQSGDTLWFISRRFNVSPESIVAVNPGVNLNSMYSGQMICVPREDGIQPAPSQEMPARPSTQMPAQPSTQVPAQPSTQMPAQPSTQMPAQPSTQIPTQPQLRTSPQPQSQRSQIQSQIQQQTPSMVRTESNSTDMVNTCPAGTYSYVIQSGDTLWLLSQRFSTTVDAIMSANPGINPMNLFIGQVICIPYGGVYPLRPQPQPQPQPQPRLEPVPRWVSSAEQTLNHYLRILWLQHVYWRRMLIQSIAFSSPNEDAITNRLLQNLRDFKTALRPFYGEESGERFEDLMTDRFTIGRELFSNIKAGNTSAADDAERRWYQNADQIAEFLGNLNPNWSVQDWKQMLYDDLAMLKVEASDMISGDYNDSIYIFENIEQEAMKMADTMSWGIVRQFHQYFGL